MNNFDIPQVDRVYLGELQKQCMFALRAVAYSEYVLNQENIDSDEFWYHIQMFLTSTANIDKMLNGSEKHYKIHHKKIITEYSLPDVDFKVERKIRNRFDHYDERIVDWITNSEHHNIIISGIFPKNAVVGNFDYFKKYDPDSNMLSFGDMEFKVADTIDKIILLDEHLKETLSTRPF